MYERSRRSATQRIGRLIERVISLVNSTGALILDGIRQAISFVADVVISAVDIIFSLIQRIIGVGGMPYIFVLPNLLIFGIFILFPMTLNFVYAFTGGTEFFPGQRPWVGTSNFETLLTCENFLTPNTCREDLFWRAVYNTAGYVVAQVSLMVVISLVTAIVLNRNIKARGFFRSVFFYPVLLSPIVVALIWKWILQENGLLNGIITSLGYDKLPFLVNATWARIWVVLISVWASMGFYTLILLAGLQSIPAELYEAAQIDGANPWQSFRNITLPLLMPTMLVVLVLSLIRAVQIFDVVFAFTGGGPGTATLYLVQYIYSNGFSSPSRQYGLAAAASLLMAGVLIILTLAQLLLRPEEV
ncbi:MAG: sugar ABC transporter permease [Anaerolineae bacterium]|jgi:alpha-1,4-digalacturonate transport system permease protein